MASATNAAVDERQTKLNVSIIESMQAKTTPELLGLWAKNDRVQWSDSAFDAIAQTLSARGMVPPQQTPYAEPSSPSHRGVKGWLLFFCLSLVVIRPVLGLLGTVALAASGQLTLAVIVLAVSVFSAYAGVKLWRVAPGAVRMAKAFLWFTLPCEAAVQILSLQRSTLDWANAKEALGVIVFFGVWYSYLGSSKRVRDTYHESIR